MLDLTTWGFDAVDIEPALIGGMLIEMGEVETVKGDLVERASRWLAGLPAPSARTIILKHPTVVLWVSGVEEPLRFEFSTAMTIARNRMQAHAFADYVREQARKSKQQHGVEAIPGRAAMHAA